MTPLIPYDAANDTLFVPFPLHRPRRRISLIHAVPATQLAMPGFEFAIASDGNDLEAAAALVGRCYRWRGYSLELPASNAGETTLVARWNGKTVGTITVRSGTRTRLQAETGFAEHVGELRRQGCRLAEYTRFAIDREALARSGHDINLAFELISRALLLGRVSLDATACLIEVNPRHARYYERAFGFRPWGRERVCERVGAPAQLLYLNLDTPPDCVAADGSSNSTTTLH